MEDAETLETLFSHQMNELKMARNNESDFEVAYRLQMEEALAASAAIAPSSSSNPPPPPSPPILGEEIPDFNLLDVQILELERFQQEKIDYETTKAEARRVVEDVNTRLHDAKVAKDIRNMPEEEWEDEGDFYQKPKVLELPVKMYFKGLVSETEKGKSKSLTAVGVAICDWEDNLLFELKRPMESGLSRREVETKALIKGMNAAIALDLKRVVAISDFPTLVQCFTGRWNAKQRKVGILIDQARELAAKFDSFDMQVQPRVHIKYVFRFAREAIDLQLMKTAESSDARAARDFMETCAICLDEKEGSQMHTVDVCSHRFCSSCMKQHVEAKLHHGVLPGCPHDGCASKLTVENSRKFLQTSPKLMEILIHRIEEAGIPAGDKLYCPYPKCSALMSNAKMLDPVQACDIDGLRKCVKCLQYFCIRCKVPFHFGMSCFQYRSRNPHPQAEDAKLKSLADKKLWRQCVKCSHMIELLEGCYHITCRCGFEFCYTCGAAYKQKRPTCKCPIWDEGNIIREDDFYDDEDDEEYNEFEDDDLLYDSDSEDDDFRNMRHVHGRRF